MSDEPLHVLTTWSNFYVITGSSAAALTGLMFVAITIIAGGQFEPSREGVSTFSTPTVVHFCCALFLSAALSAPWQTLTQAAIPVGLTGLFGIGYVVRIMHRTRSAVSDYDPTAEDWLCYALIPLASYLVLVAAAAGFSAVPGIALLMCAGAVAALIFIGIRNAWDLVTYVAVDGIANRKAPAEPHARTDAASPALRE